MNYDLIRKYLGKHCKITSTGGVSSLTGKIIEVTGNWIEFENQIRIVLINIEFIQSIEIKNENEREEVSI